MRRITLLLITLITRFNHQVRSVFWMNWHKPIGWLKLMVLTCVVSVSLHFMLAPVQAQSSIDPVMLVQQGRTAYQMEQYADAIAPLQQAARLYAQRNAPLNRALALSYLALAYQANGDRSQAEATITTSIQLLPSQPQQDNEYQVQGQVLSTQGELQFAWGQTEDAIERWHTAGNAYRRLDDQAGMLGTQVNEIQGLRTLGFYRQAQHRAEQLRSHLDQLPDSDLTLTAWRSFGNTQYAMGDHEGAEFSLKKSLSIAQNLNATKEIAAAFLSLGNLERAKGDRQLNHYLLSTRQSLVQQRYCSGKEVQDWVTTLGDEANPYDKAAQYYQKVMALSASGIPQVQAHLNAFNLAIALQPTSVLESISPLNKQLEQLPSSRFKAYATIRFAEDLACLPPLALGNEATVDSAQDSRATEGNVTPRPLPLLHHAVKMAHELNDRRAESYAWGSIGRFYEAQSVTSNDIAQHNRIHGATTSKDHRTEAKTATTKALVLAQQLQAPDIGYLWQWQLGRLLNQQGKRQEAIAHYTAAFNTLKTLRADLVVLDTDIQFSFRENIEPLYRQFTELLLRSPSPSNATTEASRPSNISPANLGLARDVIEALQLAELDNFFQDACSIIQPESLDTIIDKPGSHSAVLYAIILPDHLDIVLKLPRSIVVEQEQKTDQTKPPSDSDLRHYTIPVSAQDLRHTVQQFRRLLARPDTIQTLKPPAQQLYEWLVQPLDSDLKANNIDHIVFVLDGVLRNIPMAALYDGEQYLGDRYAISLSPGLQLLASDPAASDEPQILAAGISKSVDNFQALPNVEKELEAIASTVPNFTQLLNEDFTETALETNLKQNPISVLHLATHGKFSSQADQTFILTHDDQINIHELSDLLRQHNQWGLNTPIDLLVLSACQTASGDERAALGLAGVAIRAGARSTLASLWSVNDQATALLVSEFYRQLYNTEETHTKAEALQLAQRSVRELDFNGFRPFAHPFYWSAFVLLGTGR